jgi:hypothetical protein
VVGVLSYGVEEEMLGRPVVEVLLRGQEASVLAQALRRVQKIVQPEPVDQLRVVRQVPATGERAA